MNPLDMFRKKFEMYRKVLDETGDEQAAWDALFKGYPERQREHMGAFIDKHNTLAEAFAEAIPLYKQLGMEMEVVDISNNDSDGVLEIQKKCPIMDFNIHTEFGFTRPCKVICEMDVAATKAAFPEMTGDVLCRQADGHCVCLFKYQKPKK